MPPSRSAAAVGLAALVSLAVDRTAGLVAGIDPARAATRGFALTFAVAAVVLGVGAALALVGLGRVRPTQPEPTPPEPTQPAPAVELLPELAAAE